MWNPRRSSSFTRAASGSVDGANLLARRSAFGAKAARPSPPFLPLLHLSARPAVPGPILRIHPAELPDLGWKPVDQLMWGR
jgi:hypothetical protein